MLVSTPAQQIGASLYSSSFTTQPGYWLVIRHQLVIENIGADITDHALVSGMLGSLITTILLAPFVYIAFTLILLPLAILGLASEYLMILCGQALFRYLIGTRLPTESDGVGTLAEIAALLLGLEVLGLVPHVGEIARLTVAVIGVGAVLNTYFGTQRFEPITIPIRSLPWIQQNGTHLPEPRYPFDLEVAPRGLAARPVR